MSNPHIHAATNDHFDLYATVPEAAFQRSSSWCRLYTSPCQLSLNQCFVDAICDRSAQLAKDLGDPLNGADLIH